MIDELIRKLIKAAVESFPIDESKKTAILQKIQDDKKEGRDNTYE